MGRTALRSRLDERAGGDEEDVVEGDAEEEEEKISPCVHANVACGLGSR